MNLIEERLKHQMEVRLELLKKQINTVRNKVNSVRSGVSNSVAIQLNSLRKWLGDLMEPVLVPI